MKRVLGIVFMMPLIGFASETIKHGEQLTQEQLNTVIEYNKAEGLILPDSGLQYISAEEITDPIQKKIREKYQKSLKQIKSKGYIDEPSSNAQSLLALRQKESQAMKELVQDLAQLKLAFPFQGLAFIKKEDIIGYAGYTGWDNGWLGISEFFNAPDLGVCNFTRYNMKLSHGGVRLVADEMAYIINNKPSDYSVRGNNATGYLYDVTWYDPTYIQGLQCASEAFNPAGMDRVFRLANQIDLVP